MSVLSNIEAGKSLLPPRVVIYGTEKVGKSTFAASAPAPIFIQTEDGLGQIDCHKFPMARDFATVQASLAALRVEPHNYQTVVIDSLDWLERLVWAELCQRFNVANIEKVDGGYGKGYTHALTPWGEIVNALNALRDERGMCVIGIAHSKVEKFADPEQSLTYDRYSPKLHKLASALLCEWADAILFATHRVILQTEDTGFKKTRATARSLKIGDSDRVMKCIGGPAFVAGNRYSLPPELPLSWDAFVSAMTATP